MKYSIAILALLFADSKLVVPTTADSVKERRISDLKGQVQRLHEANQRSDFLPKQLEELLDTLASTMEKTGEMDSTNGEGARFLSVVSEEMSMAMIEDDTDTDVSPFGFTELDFNHALPKLLALLAEIIKYIEEVKPKYSKAWKHSSSKSGTPKSGTPKSGSPKSGTPKSGGPKGKSTKQPTRVPTPGPTR